MGSEVLKERTKQFALDILKLVESLSNQKSQNSIANQIVRSATSVGANYRAACRSRSDKEFVSKMNIVLEEADEVVYWLEIIQEMKWIKEEELKRLLKEANELVAIVVVSLKTINARLNKS